MKKSIGWLAVVVALSSTGCIDLQLPAEYPLSSYKRSQLIPKDKEEPFEVKAEDQRSLANALDKRFSPPWTWDRGSITTDEQASVHSGQALYQQHCIHCHGLAGAGNGPTSPFLFPRPRDYRNGKFKWKSTSRNSKPTKADLVSILRQGAEGTSMPSFKLLGEDSLSELADYVIYLSKRGEVERRLLLKIEEDGELPNDEGVSEVVASVDASWFEAENAVVKPEKPDYYADTLSESANEQALLRGRNLFLQEKAGCYKCHGVDGLADPKQITDPANIVDDWNNRNYPRNLTLGLFRGGRRPADLYRRIHEGISGAAMPEAKGKLTPEEIWDLVRFVRALPHRKGLLGPNTTTAPGAKPHAANQASGPTKHATIPANSTPVAAR